MEPQEQIFGLLAIAKEQQAAIKAALDALALERAALAQERAALHQIAGVAHNAAGAMQRSAADAVPGIQQAAASAVSSSVASSMQAASKGAAMALRDACGPVVTALDEVAARAREAEAQLHGAAKSFGWKWVFVSSGAVLALGAAVWAVSVGNTAWQRREIDSLKAERAAVQDEIAQMKTVANDLARRGGRAQWNTCGEKARLCIRVDTTPGSFTDANGGGLYIIKGY